MLLYYKAASYIMEDNKKQGVDKKAPTTRVIQLSNYVKPPIVESRGGKWVLNGPKNGFFQYIIDRYNGSPTNAALNDAYMDRIYGKGLSIVNSKTNAAEYAALLSIISKKDLKKVIADFQLFGSVVGQIRYGKGTKRRIAAIEHLDRQMTASGKVNDDGEVDTYFVSRNWANTNQNPPKRYPAFGTSNEKIEIFEIRPYSAGKTYYADPDYLAGLQYAMLEEEISNFSVNHIKNGLSMGWVINYHNGIPSEEVQADIERRLIGKTTGSNNSGRVVLNFSDGKDLAPEVIAIPSNANHEQWQFWADEARQQLLVAHRVTTPMLFGVKDNTGLGNNANELKEGSKLLHETTIRPKQTEILDALQEIVAVNDIASPLIFVPLEDEEEKKEIKKENDPLVKTPELEEIQTELSKHALQKGAQYLVSLGEEMGEDWEVLEDRAVNRYSLTEGTLNNVMHLASVPSTPSKGSGQDTSLFKIRYEYTGNLLPERPFCQILMASNKVYRQEDLEAAENMVVNEGFGVGGANKYSIFLYKGGVNCKHWWKRIIFLKKGNTRIGVNEARKMILELDPKDRADAKWEQNPKEVAVIASPSNNHWRVN